MNQQVATNLEKIIASLQEEDQPPSTEVSADAS